MRFIFRILFIAVFLTISIFIVLIFLKPIFLTDSLIFPYALHPFDICKLYPIVWKFIKDAYMIFLFTSSFIIANSLFDRYFQNIRFRKSPPKKELDSLHLCIGQDSNNTDIIISEFGLYQNFLITGTIGTGKTSSAMYPFSKQLISYTPDKLGMLILDVKGNFHEKISEFCEFYDREDDLIVIELRW